MQFRLVSYEPMGDPTGVLPDALEIKPVVSLSDAATLQVQYPRAGVNAESLRARIGETGVEYWDEDTAGWVEPPNCRFLHMKGTDDHLDETPTVSVDMVHAGNFQLSHATVWSTDGLREDSDGKAQFLSATAGEILAPLMQRAQDRGWGAGIGWDFTTSQTSDGVSFEHILTIAYDPDMDLNTILSNLRDQQVIDYRWQGRTLQLFNPHTVMARETEVQLVSPDGHQAAPNEWSNEDLKSHVRVVGEDGLSWEFSNPATTALGRLESVITQGGVSDPGTADLLSRESLLAGEDTRVSRTREFVVIEGAPAPFRDYVPGDWVDILGDGGAWERLRIHSISITVNDEGTSGHATLGDRLDDLLTRIAKQTKGITGGATTGGSGVRPNPEGPDTRHPAAPEGLVASTNSYLNDAGLPRGLVSLEWAPVDVAENGAGITVDRYEVTGADNTASAQWGIRATTEEVSHQVSPLEVYYDDGETVREYKWRVRAISEDGVASAWSDTVALQVAYDTEPPPSPMLRAEDVTTTLGTVRVTATGLDSEGVEMPRDLSHFLVHTSGSQGGPWELVEVRPGDGPGLLWQSESLPADVAVWVQITAMDTTGNESDPSAAHSVTPSRLVDEESIAADLQAVRDDMATHTQQADRRLNTLNSRADDHDTAISGAVERISTAEGRLDVTEDDVAEAQTSASNAQQAAEEASAAAVEAAQNAGNRLENGGFERDLDSWITSGVTITTDAHSGEQAALISDGGTLSPEASVPAPEDSIWEVALWGKASSGTLDLAVVELDDAGSTVGVVDSQTVQPQSTWASSGGLRATMPTGTERASVEVSAVGGAWTVDDVTLRDVTDVVRLEQAATEARQKAEAAESKANAVELQVQGIDTRLDTAENTLTEKADKSSLSELDERMSETFEQGFADLRALTGAKGTIWTEDTQPPAGTTYEWAGTPHASESIKRVDGVEVARNYIANPSFEDSGDVGAVGDGVTVSRNISHTPPYGDWSLRVDTGADMSSWSSRVVPQGQAPADGDGYVAFALSARRSNTDGDYLALMVQELGTGWTDYQYYDFSYGGWYRYVYSAPISVDTYGLIPTLTVLNAPNMDATSGDGGAYNIDGIHVATADTEDEALAQVETYFDGDSTDDRAHDLWIGPDGIPHRWDSATNDWVAIEDQRIIDAAQAAQDAQTTADSALTMAGQKTTVKYSSGPPSEDGTTEGDLWRQVSSNGTTEARWRWDGTSWQDDAVTSEVIDNLDVGKLTAGVAEVVEAVTDKLLANHAIIRRLEAEAGFIGGSMFEDGAIITEVVEAAQQVITDVIGANIGVFEQEVIVDGDLFARNANLLSAAIRTLDVTERANLVNAFVDELYADEFVARVSTVSRQIVAARNLIPPLSEQDQWNLSGSAEIVSSTVATDGVRLELSPESSSNAYSPIFPVTPGDQYDLTVKGRRYGDSEESGGKYYVGIVGIDPATGDISSYGPYTQSGTSSFGWDTDLGGTITIPDGVTHAQVRLHLRAATGTPDLDAYTTFYDVRLENKLDGRLLVDGTIQTRHLESTESILTDALRARKIDTGDLEANAVTAAEIEGGAIEGQHISGRIIEGKHIEGDTFQGETFTGGTFEGADVVGGYVGTATTGERVYMEGNSITARDSNGNVRARYWADGLEVMDPGGEGVRLTPNAALGRPGMFFDTGDIVDSQPAIAAFNFDSSVPAYYRGKAVMFSREVDANESGRGEVQVGPGNGFALLKSGQSHAGNGTGITGASDLWYLDVKGRHRNHDALGQVVTGEVTGIDMSETNVSAFWVSYGAPVPTGKRRLQVTPSYLHSSSYHRASVGVWNMSASQGGIVIGETTGGTTWRLIWEARWV